MSDYVENKISLASFEANGANYNSKKLKRSFFDVLKHIDEYEGGALVDKEDYNKFVIEGIIDKSSVDNFLDLLNHYYSYKELLNHY